MEEKYEEDDQKNENKGNCRLETCLVVHFSATLIFMPANVEIILEQLLGRSCGLKNSLKEEIHSSTSEGGKWVEFQYEKIAILLAIFVTDSRVGLQNKE